MSKVNNGDMPAMPCDEIILRDNNGDLHGCPVTGSGLTKLEYFAGLAMQGLCSKSHAPDTLATVDKVAAVSVEMAKSLLAQLEKGNE